MNRIPACLLRQIMAPVLLSAGAVVLASGPAAADAPALCREAKALKDAGELDAAARAYREAIRLDPAGEEAWWGLAWVCRKQGAAATAVEAFRKVVELARDPARRRDAEAALERMGATVTQPEPPVDDSLEGARDLIRRGRSAEALRLLRTLRARESERVEAESLMAEVKRGRRLVRVRAAADEEFRSLPGWEERLRARLAAAAGEVSRQLEVDFELVGIEPWRRGETAPGGMAVVADLQAAVPDAGVDLVVGFVAERHAAPPEGERLEIRGHTMGLAPCFAGTVVVTEVIASRDGAQWRVPEANLRENLTHELGHCFGAVHVMGPSVMRAQPDGAPLFDFDALNLEAMRACRWVDFREQFLSLEPAELQRLEAAYQRLAAGPAGDDGAHFYRALALTYLERHQEAIGEYEAVLRTSRLDAYAYLNLGKLYELTGDLDKARTHWKLAAALGTPPAATMAREELARTEP
ncbi:MAG: tetratricopeptide repeat protein [Armatimonadetes bacterium]|nr:tetratricopeptide repeat protein [Armatimonadota bacterium]